MVTREFGGCFLTAAEELLPTDILMQASFKEGLTKKLARVDEIFYPTTLDT